VDAATVYPEILQLWRFGYRIWYDEGIEVGEEWPEAVAGALEACSSFLVFVSPQAARSKNVRDEVHRAIELRKPFVIVQLEETDLPPGLALRLGTYQAILKHRMTRKRYTRKLFRGLGGDCQQRGQSGPPPLVPEMEEAWDVAQPYADTEDGRPVHPEPIPALRREPGAPFPEPPGFERLHEDLLAQDAGDEAAEFIRHQGGEVVRQHVLALLE
jgi:hypothetical protein